MYLKSIKLTSVGPISNLALELPFKEKAPIPLVLVGSNGSGKTTALSFIVNALVALKQQVFEDSEVESNKVYRIRSGLFLKGGANYYHAKLTFEEDVSLEEWVLDRPKSCFEKEVNPKPTDDGWKSMPDSETHHFTVSPTSQSPPFGQRPEPKLAKLFAENVVLFFPSDRFEPPDWLNQENLSIDLRFPEPVLIQGRTARRIFARSLLKPTLDWLQAVIFDQLINEREPIGIPKWGDGLTWVTQTAFLETGGRNSQIVQTVREILARILHAESSHIQLGVEGRHSRRFSVTVQRSGQQPERIPNLLGLSAGQSALFCLFTNIIRDADLAGIATTSPTEIRGIVLIDEADLHLHHDLQYTVFPALLKMFPKVQFIVTAHSPIFVLGMKQTFGDEGFQLVEMPSGQQIFPEAYSEFLEAFEAFGPTKTFQSRVLSEVRASTKPVLFVEGKNDVRHLETAWEKIFPGTALPFSLLSCGAEGGGGKNDKGGAKRLNALLEVLTHFEERMVVGLFDNDREGAAQFNGLGVRQGFNDGIDSNHRQSAKHSVHAVLLPPPAGREDFIPASMQLRLLELEHYYSDDVLQRYGVAGAPAYPGASAFPITDSTDVKSRFAEAVASLPLKEFAHFNPLFERLIALTNPQFSSQ